MTIDRLWQDLRFSGRILRKSPSFTILAAFTLALGIGASTAIFSAVNALLLRPMPGQDTSHLLAVWAQYSDAEEGHKLSYPDYQAVRAENSAFSDMCAYALGSVVLSADGRSDRVIASYVTGNFFSALGMTPEAGRLLRPGEGDTPGTGQVIVLGYSFWQTRFHGDPSVVGKSITVRGSPLTIAGVAPRKLVGPFTPIETSAYLPLDRLAQAAEAANFFTDRSTRELYVLAQPKDGVSQAQARSSLQVIADRLAQDYPATNKSMRMNVVLERLARPSPEDTSGTLLVAGVFLSQVGLALMIACIDVTNLLLARASRRNKEMAVRVSLGAGRLRLLQQLLTESLLLAMLGGVGGALLGWWLSRVIASIRLPIGVPIRLDASFDWRVFACIAAIVVMCAIVVGAAPARHAFRLDLNASLREGGRAEFFGSSHRRARGALVIAQIAFSLLVMVTAGLFVRSLTASQEMNLGYRPEGVLNVTLDASQPGYDESRSNSFFRVLKQRINALPGVQSAAYAVWTPMGFYKQGERVWKEGQTGTPGTSLEFDSVDEDYFRTLEIPIVQGRPFTSQDREDTAGVAVINEAMARLFWPHENPVGHKFHVGKPGGPLLEVLGVARDARYDSLFEPPQPFFFRPLSQSYSARRVLHARTYLPAANLANAIEKLSRDLDANVPLYDVMTMQRSLGGPSGFFLLRVGASFAGALGALCLALAVVGVYGVVSYATAQRTHEVGVRVALGAQRRDVLRLLMNDGARLILAGLAIGVGMALGLAHLMSSLLYGIGTRDPLTFSLCAIFMAAIATMACYLPARRAMRVDPMAALRHE